MKQQIPWTPVVLAGITLVFAWLSEQNRAGTSPASTHQNEPELQRPYIEGASAFAAQPDAYVPANASQRMIQLASFQEAIVTDDSITPVASAPPAASAPPEAANKRAAAPAPAALTAPHVTQRNVDIASTRLIQSIARNIETGPATEATFQISSEIFDTHVQGYGRLIQEGQGSRRARMEIEFGRRSSGASSDKPARKMTQICDGRFLFRIFQGGDQDRVEFVDLNRIGGIEGRIAAGLLPATLNGDGRLSNMLRQVAKAFEFATPVHQTIAGKPVMVISGRWRPKTLETLLSGLVEKKHLFPVVHYDRLPAQIPHGIEIVLEQGGGRAEFQTPMAIRFVQFESSRDLSSPQTMLAITFQSIQQVASVSDAMFEMVDDGNEATDMTNIYNMRIKKMVDNQDKVAANLHIVPPVRHADANDNTIVR